MTGINVITSCSRAGWQEYGRRFVETFLQHWPADVGLHLVSEDDLDTTSQGWPRSFNFWRLSESARAAEFDRRHRDNPRMHGRVKFETDAGWSPRKQQRGYNFRYDAYRFAKKVFAIELVAHAAAKTERLFWIDADVVTFAPVPPALLERLLPADKALSCLDRGTSYHSECGFVGYNLDHAMGRPFIAAFAALYASDRVCELGEWHDSWVFDWLRRDMKVPTYAIPHNSRHHPFVNSELGLCMDHLKGARKERGRTPIAEVLSSKKRALPYWQGAQR